MSKAPIFAYSLVFCWLGACAAPLEDPPSQPAVGESSAAISAPVAEVRVEIGEAKLVLPADKPLSLRPPCNTDSDCNDGNACTRDVCDVSAHCSSALIDEDGDGFAPASLGSCGHDCDDKNPLVNPAQTHWFDVPYVTATGERSFDYDCDGSVALEHADFGYCIGAATPEESTCSCVAGWRDRIPECGSAGEYAEASTCGVTTSATRLQACR